MMKNFRFLPLSALVLFACSDINITADPGYSDSLNKLPPSRTTGTAKVAVIPINFSINPTTPFTKEQVHDAWFGEYDPNRPERLTAKDFFQEVSYGKLAIEGEVSDWVTIEANPANICDDESWAKTARDRLLATQPGFRLSEFTYFVYVFAPGHSCRSTHASFVGGNEIYSFQRNFQRSANQPWPWLTFAHEFGHLLGLAHSGQLSCKDPFGEPVSISANCIWNPSYSQPNEEYGDTYDMMGFGSPTVASHFNAMQLSRLGWLNKTNIANIDLGNRGTDQPVSFTLAPIERSQHSTAAGLSSIAKQALSIVRPGDTNGRFWVELRARSRYDQFISTGNIEPGVLIHYSNVIPFTATDRSLLVLPRGTTLPLGSEFLRAGETFYDSFSGVTITVRQSSMGSAQIDVTLGASVETVKNSATLQEKSAPGSIAILNGSQLLGPGVLTATPDHQIVLTSRLGHAYPAAISTATPNRIEFVLPPNIGTGSYRVDIRRSDSVLASSQVNVKEVAPGFFTSGTRDINNNGGSAVAMYLRDGENLFHDVDDQHPIPRGSSQRPTILLLYGTGMKNAKPQNSQAAFYGSGGELITIPVAGIYHDYGRPGIDVVELHLKGELPLGTRVINFFADPEGYANRPNLVFSE